MNTKIILEDSGISLLEVLVAMIILGMSLIVLLNMSMVALDGNDWANKNTAATQVMQQKLEQLRNISNLNSGASGNDTIDGVVRKWEVSNAAQHLKKVDVEVTWQDIRGDRVSSSLTSYIKTDSI